MTEPLLAIHLLGAAILAVIAVSATLVILRRQPARAAVHAKGLAVLALFQVGSGSALAFAAPGGSALGFCSKVGLYLGAVILLEILLYRVARTPQEFPRTVTVGTLAMALTVTVLTVAVRY